MARDPAPSILARLEADGRTAPRVRLKDVPDEASPTLAEVELRPGARFDVLGQIAQGGVGRVVKGRDVDLGRDVALKVLLEKHLDNTDLVRRFVEEAQIGGQLTHPGIVPVYELGLLPDRQPFFAMKLVKGKTLAALIAERTGGAGDRRQLLSVFEKVCRTMAYAHSRGVIHRDLKPSNVMVGAFGEVQLLDWGFAKVLEQGGIADEKRRKLEQADITRIATLRSEGVGSESIPGSVMGTPAYMPPEQALGHIDELDERSDVFSLGAILTEVLTGDPPYVGAESPMDCVIMAMRGEVEAAKERLDACGADPALTDIAKRCLSPLRKDRPRDAGEMAEAVAAYLSEVDARAHRSRVAAEEAREEAARAQAQAAEQHAKAEAAKAKAEAERARTEQARARAEAARAEARQLRRKRIQTLALAGSVLLVLLIGGGAWAWIANDRHTQEQEASRAVNDALKEAAHAQGEGDLPKALALATKARDLAQAQGADEDTRARADSLVSELVEERRAAEEWKNRSREDAELLAALEAARIEAAELGDEERRETASRAAFEKSGLDIVNVSEEEAAAWVRSRTCPEDIAAELDIWAFWRSFRREDYDWKRLQEIALLADPEPFRERARKALLNDRKDEIVELAENARPEELPAANLLWLSLLATHVADDRGVAQRLVREGVRLHPGHWGLRYELASLLAVAVDRFRTDEELREAVEHLTAAIALRPEHSWAWSLRGSARRLLGEVEESVADARRAADLAPKLATLHANLGNALRQAGEAKAAVAAYEKALKLEPGRKYALSDLGNALMDLGEVDRAEEVYRRGLDAHPDDPFLTYNLAVLYMNAKRDYATARDLLQELADRAPDAMGLYSLGNALRDLGEHQGAVKEYERALELVTDSSEWMFRRSTRAREPGEASTLKGAILGNMGSAFMNLRKFDEARKAYEEALRIDPGHAKSSNGLANALWGGGEPEKALGVIEKTVRSQPDYPAAHITRGAILAELGRLSEARVALEEAVRRFPNLPTGHFNLAVTRSRQGGWLGAEAAYRKCTSIKHNPHLPAAHRQLGYLLIDLGLNKEGVAEVQRAIKLAPSDWTAYRILGLGHMLAGRLGEARSAYTDALTLAGTEGKQHCKEQLESVELRQALEKRLPAILAGTDSTEGVEDTYQLAFLLICRNTNHALALSTFLRAFELDPTRREGSLGGAAIAAIGAGDREQALALLRETVEVQRESLEGADEVKRGEGVKGLRYWQLAPEAAPVRDEEALSRLPESERNEWRAFWAEVDELIREAEK